MKKRLVSLVTICFLFLFNASVIVSASESINGEGNMEFYIERDAIADQLDVRPSQIVAIEAVDEMYVMKKILLVLQMMTQNVKLRLIK